MAVRRATEGVGRVLLEEVQRWGGMKQTGVGLRHMMEFGSHPTERKLMQSAQFLHKELPIRIARRSSSSMISLRDWYLDSFRDLRSFPDIRDASDELDVVPTMALGVQQLKKDLRPKAASSDLEGNRKNFDGFLLKYFFWQHVALHDSDAEPAALAKSTPRCRCTCCLHAAYGDAPDVNIYGDPNFTFPYVASHLHLMMFELVKNSLRAVQERYVNSDKDAPPVRIIVADGEEDVTIKCLSKLFTYLYSTAEAPQYEHHNKVNNGVTMAGYGYGLPISRLYARYFGGDLQIISMEGYGANRRLPPSVSPGDSQEPLP
ncbi:unnamed protein product [Spirodela intermedia]|uniref:Protein-serine/threonine kinase n=1 Tax=Spirodela intermedia TaxID=51605 RepID=A0A7I8I8G4_SPIIN|nr:unnamed protein product [Spirodela intermedia]CAA6653947.1 unnamed protein product [Spirodela intermedia]